MTRMEIMLETHGQIKEEMERETKKKFELGRKDSEMERSVMMLTTKRKKTWTERFIPEKANFENMEGLEGEEQKQKNGKIKNFFGLERSGRGTNSNFNFRRDWLSGH